MTSQAMTLVSSSAVSGMLMLAPFARHVPESVGRLRLVICAKRSGYMMSVDAEPINATAKKTIILPFIVGTSC